MSKIINCVSKGLIAVEILWLDAVGMDVVATVTAVVMDPVMVARNAVISAAATSMRTASNQIFSTAINPFDNQ